MTAAILITMFVGFNVYLSCTRYSHIRRMALTIDAIGAVAIIAIFYMTGVWS